MNEYFAVTEGDYGRVEVVEHQHNLVMHANPHTHFAFWLGGGLAHSRMGQHLVQLGPDMALGVNTHASHDLRLHDDAKPVVLLNLYLNEGWLDAQYSAQASPMVLAHPSIGCTTAIRKMCQQLLSHLVSLEQSKNLLIEKDVHALVCETISSAMSPQQLQTLPRRRRLIDYRLRVAIAHMQDNLGNRKIAEEVAEVVGMSRSRFFELFQKQLGTSPLVFWNGLRLEKALTHLNLHDEDITSLALDLGFSTTANFSRFFREHRGVTPTTYRRVSHAA